MLDFSRIRIQNWIRIHLADPRIQIRIHIKMKLIRNTKKQLPLTITDPRQG